MEREHRKRFYVFVENTPCTLLTKITSKMFTRDLILQYLSCWGDNLFYSVPFSPDSAVCEHLFFNLQGIHAVLINLSILWSVNNSAPCLICANVHVERGGSAR